MDNNYSQCYGCGLCTLVCPVWHQSHHVCCTPHGHAKALQSGGDVNVSGLFDCILCGACEPVCPEKIDILKLILELRHKINNDVPLSLMAKPDTLSKNKLSHDNLLLADDALFKNTRLLEQTLQLLNADGFKNIKPVLDNGSDITQALQSGKNITDERLKEFLKSINTTKKLIVSDGLLKKALQQWLPSVKILSLGYVLSKLSGLQAQLDEKDLYVIECKSYNADFNNTVAHYNQLKQKTGCQLNLDLQRLAMPTGIINIKDRPQSAGATSFNMNKQSQWILQGLDIKRIVVECVEDGLAMAKVSDKPIIHIAELLNNGT